MSERFLEIGYGDFDQHYTTGRQIRSLPSYECNDETGELQIFDPIWGECQIGEWEGDGIFSELYRHPVFQRLAAIEQLTLPKQYATMPGSVEFTRWEHVWGSVVFVRKMIEDAEAKGRTFDPREKLTLQLRTLLSDAGHTAFSHLGDWLKQGFGGSEDSHDQTLEQFLEDTGVSTILRRHNIQPEEVIFPDTQDWVECDSPDLCVDRVDYGVREIDRWVLPGATQYWKNAFTLDEQNRLIMKNERLAKMFGAGFGLLATEHWGHPVHRMQLQFFGELIKSAIMNGGTFLRDEPMMHPLDALYTIDSDLMMATRQVGPLNNNLHAVMLDVARAQRRIFSWGREHEISRFMELIHVEDLLPDFPHPLSTDSSWQMRYSGAVPQNIEVLPVTSTHEIEDFGQRPYCFDMHLTPLKPRGVDPLFYDDDGNVQRLSETDSHFRELLSRHRALQSQAYAARLYLAPNAVQDLRESMTSVQEEWEKAIQLPRTPDSARALYENMKFIGGMALGHSPNSIRLV